MATIIKGKDANRLLMTGVGVFGATFVAAQATDIVDNSQNQIVKNYAREIVGAGLTLAGALMMGNKDMQVLGVAVGGTGVATIVAGLVKRARGATAATVQNGDQFQLIPSYPFGDGSDYGGVGPGNRSVILAGDNGRPFYLV